VNQIIDELLFLSRADAQAITVDLKEQGGGIPARLRPGRGGAAEHHGRVSSTHTQGEGVAAFEEKRMRQVLLNLPRQRAQRLASAGASPLHSEI
jgi:two-component system heavy metal sensor histidine kinase CusS